MQLLLHGWLAIAFGHSVFFLFVYAAVRLVPKLLLTVPAGIVCDRVPRSRITCVARLGYAVASLLPIIGLFAGTPLVWLFCGAALAGAIHPFELSASRSLFADIVAPEDYHSAVALNRAGSHIASMVGPVAAFVLISSVGNAVALLTSAVFLALGALVVLGLPHIEHTPRIAELRSAPRVLANYLRQSPATGLLILVGVVPTFIDKVVVLLLPSLAPHGDGAVSLALLAPELGALAAAVALAMSPVRLGVKALSAAALLYAGFLYLASTQAQEAVPLVLALGLAGMASTALHTATYARLLGVVPVELRGRVLAL